MKHLSIFLLSLFIQTAYAQNVPRAKENQFTKNNLSFIENKGQITDQYGNSRHDIQYKVAGRGVSIFVGNGQLHYQFSKADPKPIIKDKKHFVFGRRGTADTTATHYTMYRLDMQLQGANPQAQPLAEEKQAYYENYHTTALNTDSAGVSAYNKITYKNIYPFIDWVLYIKDNTLEYDFIVRPGGDVNDIKIHYNGATDIAHTDGNIKIKTPLGDVSEHKLYAYEQSTHMPVSAQFNCHKNTISFSLYGRHCEDQSNLQSTIVIDPTLAWGTYFGGDGEDQTLGTTVDNYGNVFITGYTSSVSNIATTGGYQVVFGGYQDVFLAKFNGANGSILWATYYGGTGQDNGYSVACDKAGNSYITGFTVSANSIATAGAHETVYQGGWDVFLAKFNSSGIIQWGTYYGGSRTDEGWAVVCDATGNSYIAGVTSSISNIATSGSYQDTMGDTSGGNNAFLAKFNTNGLHLWGTYFGGGGKYGDDDGVAAFACTIDNMDGIYITGEVEGANIYTTPGCYQDTCVGGAHCFIAKFDSACNLEWSTYYAGDSGESAQGIACDDSLNVYITGSTYSANGIATIGAYQTTYLGSYRSGFDNADAFLAKFNSAGAIQWATYYGGLNDDEGMSVTCDHNEHVYIAGYTNSTDRIATLDGFYTTYMGGIDDAYLAKLSTSGAMLWATYYGGDLGDGANGVVCDGNGNIYLAGGTASSSNVATPGTYQSNWTDRTDAFLVKFDTGYTDGIKVIQNINNVQLFPNPNNGNFTITGTFLNVAANNVTIEILNAIGQEIYKTNCNIQNGQLNQALSLQAVAAGEYLMTLSVGSASQTIKFTIQP